MVRVGFKAIGASIIADQLQENDMEGEVVYAVGTPVEYSIYQEVGTSRHAAQPYMRPAVNHANRRKQAVLKKHDDLDDAIEELARMVRDRSKDLAPVDTGTLRDSIHMERRR